MEKEDTGVLKMDTLELQKILDEDMKDRNEKKHYFVHGILIVLLIFSMISFVMSILNPDHSSIILVKDLLLTLFCIFYVVTSITYRRYRKTIILFSSILFLTFLILNLLFDSNHISTDSVSFSGKSVQSVMKWAKKNHVDVEQSYEYSDLVDEYHVIYQDYNQKKKTMKISISEGINPYKEIILPSMITWNSSQVLDFVKKNYLSNVTVDYISSDQAADTVISQSVTGSIRRNDEVQLVFSYGEELGFQEVPLMDLSNKSRFEVEMLMKKNHLRYELLEEFSDKVKKGFVIKQSIPTGTNVTVDHDVVQITMSKGPSVKILDFKDYDTVKITDWAIQNKMKIHFSQEYDDSVAKGKILSISPNVDEEVMQGSSIEVVISRGELKMPKFQNLNDFYEWANKHNISYLEEHEFSDKVKAGEVIRYSYKEGETIKNSDAITVVISDGSKKTVPNLVGLSKEEAISKLENLGLNYNFVYKDSESNKDTVLKQSISPNSEISTGLTITLTLSN